MVMRFISAEATLEVVKHIPLVKFPILAEDWIRESSTN